MTFGRRLAAYARLSSWRAPPVDPAVEIIPARPVRQLSSEDIPLIVASRNEGHLLDAFLRHYRGLGVTRFLWVDDASDDGSQQKLAEQDDVDLYTSNVRYSAARRSRTWREMLAKLYGRNRWYVSVDADEFLVYRNSNTVGLRDVLAQLTRRGIKHLGAPMLDMYPPGRVASAAYDGTLMPWEVAACFDASGYSIKRGTRAVEISGGVRKRAFNSDPFLMKYPLIFWTGLTGYPRSIHAPAPAWRNFSPPMGALLHFKFFSDFRPRFQANVREGQHHNGARLYADILDTPKLDDLVLENETSAFYSGPEDLHRRGFFTDWR